MIHVGDCLDVIPRLPSKSVHVAITSPPYWNLRSYGGNIWEGGDPSCTHKKDFQSKRSGLPQATIDRLVASGYPMDGPTCTKCGATRKMMELGNEESPDLYVDRLAERLSLLHRVLRDDGTLWVNIGDSYRDKQLELVGAKFAIKMQEMGWFLRNDVIWAKKSFIPESVRDRLTRSYEHFYFFSNTPDYYFDLDAIKEESKDGGTRQKRDIWYAATSKYRVQHELAAGSDHYAMYSTELIEPVVRACASLKGACITCGAPQVRVSRRTGKTKALSPLENKTLRWEPTCPHRDGWGASTVLDPFCGTGTTGEVAMRYGHHFVGIELLEETAGIARRRVGNAVPKSLGRKLAEKEASA